MSHPTPGLAHFLAESKAKYLDAVKDGSSKEWTVVMGNEAGGKADHLLPMAGADELQTWTRLSAQ